MAGFKSDFLWGGDISAEQIEGAWDVNGRTPCEMDYMIGVDKNHPTMRYGYYQMPDDTEGTMIQFSGQLPQGAKMIIKEGENYPNHVASDFYHHYQEDLALLGEMGFTALNLTISWARIYPHGVAGGVNQKGVAFYRDVLTECRAQGMEPIVTLYKYDMPFFYIEDWGGWSNRALIDEYVEFCRVCMTEYRDLVRYWITFNELNVLKMGLNMNPSVTTQDRQRIYEESHNQLVASAKVVQLGHEINPAFKVGCMCCGLFYYAFTSDPEDVAAVQKYEQDAMYFFSDVMVRGSYPSYAVRVLAEAGVDLQVSAEDAADLKAGTVDFFAFSYYFSGCLTTHETDLGTARGNMVTGGVKNPYLTASEWGWQIDPLGLKIALHRLSDRYPDTPLLIVENGLGAQDTLEPDGTVHDPYRIEYLQAHIAKMREAVEEGVNLIGYTMWSCIDLISASTGEMRKRYGFIYVDAADDGTPQGSYRRYKKDSFCWYQRVCKSNGEDLGL